MRRPIENAMKINEKMNAEWPIVFLFHQRRAEWRWLF